MVKLSDKKGRGVMDKTLENNIRAITIATAAKSTSKNWKNRSITINDFFKELQTPVKKNITRETYQKLSKEDKDKTKNVKSFVGGKLINDGPRTKDTVIQRDLITLDIDNCNDIQEQELRKLLQDKLNSYTYLAYPTISNTEVDPRYRVVLPMSRSIIDRSEYEALCRIVAHNIDPTLNMFDKTGYQFERLMYYPCELIDENSNPIINYSTLIDVDGTLGEYDFLGNGWQDRTEWYYSDNEKAKLNKQITDKQQDPILKSGIIGAFCRVYSISEAIDTFLSDDYTLCSGKDGETRYTYSKGSTYGGAIVYDDKFLYSHHSTDPSSETLCNSFDLVRIHKFGYLDNEVKPGRKPKDIPSFKAMEELASKDKKVRIEIGKENLSKAQEEFSEIVIDEDNDTEWLSELEYTEKGILRPTSYNYKLILLNDPTLKGKLGYNEFSANIQKTSFKLPWKTGIEKIEDNDLAELKCFIQRAYKINNNTNFIEGLTMAAYAQAYHPVRDYFDSLIWDGELRADKVLIDFMGADDNLYTRNALIKMLLAAVTRIYNPGTKFDSMLVLSGPQGLGKSELIKRLSHNIEWFTDNKVDIDDSKKVIENYGGRLLIEIAELDGFSKKENSSIKRFITAVQHIARMAFMKTATTYMVQYVLFGTTNEENFLSDRTGNRRFLPIKCYPDRATKNVFKDLNSELVNQIWAEVVHMYKDYKKNNIKDYLLLDNESMKYADEVKKEVSGDFLQDIIIDKFDFDAPKDKWTRTTPTELISSLNLSDYEKRYARNNIKAILKELGIEQL